MQALNNVLEEISKHPLDEQEMIVEIANKRLIEKKRELIYRNYKQAKKDSKAGRTQSGTVEDLFKEIDK